MDKKSKRLSTLKQKQAQIKAQIQSIEAAEKTRERKRDTRRKILIGAYYLDQAKTDGNFEKIITVMGGYLKRHSDRSLFELAPLESETSDHGQSE